MNKVRDYPIMTEFLGGAFHINSRGTVSDTLPINGTPEEWAAAERWWEEFLPNDAAKLRYVRWLGIQADAGYTLYEQAPETGDEVPVLAWRLLDRYY